MNQVDNMECRNYLFALVTQTNSNTPRVSSRYTWGEKFNRPYSGGIVNKGKALNVGVPATQSIPVHEFSAGVAEEGEEECRAWVGVAILGGGTSIYKHSTNQAPFS